MQQNYLKNICFFSICTLSSFFLLCLHLNSFSKELSIHNNVNSNHRIIDRELLKDIKVFGVSYFVNNATAIMQMNRNKPIQSDYVVGPKDVFLIKVRGVTNEEYRVEVNQRGVLSFAKIPSIYVAGLTIQKAREKILNQVLAGLKNVDVEIEIIDLKDISVIATGNIKQPGSYTIRANNTIMDLLYIAGGPTEIGSFRNIELIRQVVSESGKQSEERTIIDLYDLFIRGIHKSIVLESGDRIQIPSISNHSTIIGEIKSPAQYEWKNDTTIKEFVQMSGGFTPEANTHRIQLFRINENNNYTFSEIDFTLPENQITILRDGDIIRVISNTDVLLENNIFVKIDGRVNYPGQYILKRNSKLSELLSAAGGVKSDAYLKGVTLVRERLIEDQKQIQSKVFQELEAKLLKIQADLTENAVLNDDQMLMMKAQNLRQNLLQSQGSILFEGRLIFDPSKEDPVLHNDDSVFIPPEPDSVTVIGSVKNSGSLLYQEDWNVEDYLNHVGGITQFALRTSIYIVKSYGHVINITDNNIKIDKGDVIVVPTDVDTYLPRINNN